MGACFRQDMDNRKEYVTGVGIGIAMDGEAHARRVVIMLEMIGEPCHFDSSEAPTVSGYVISRYPYAGTYILVYRQSAMV